MSCGALVLHSLALIAHATFLVPSTFIGRPLCGYLPHLCSRGRASVGSFSQEWHGGRLKVETKYIFDIENARGAYC